MSVPHTVLRYNRLLRVLLNSVKKLCRLKCFDRQIHIFASRSIYLSPIKGNLLINKFLYPRSAFSSHGSLLHGSHWPPFWWEPPDRAFAPRAPALGDSVHALIRP